MSDSNLDLNQAVAPGLFRRLAAIFYDSLLLAGVLVLASALVTLANGGDKIEGGIPLMLFQLYLLTLVYLYFGWHWVHGGQTLGMRAWRLKLLDDKGRDLIWSNASIRFLSAIIALLPLGLGLVWSLLDPDSLTWHDRLSKTRLVLVVKKA